MKRRIPVIGLIVVGVLALLLVLVGPGAQLLVRLGVRPVCIQGEFPNLRVVSCPDSATATPLPLPTAGAEPVPVIFDDDGSPDGMIALLFFLRDPRYEVVAVTISVGEAHPQVFAEHVAQILAALGRADIPVGYGRETPLAGENAFPAPWRQASDEFWGIELPEAQNPVEPRPAAELMVETLTRATRPVLVFVSGTQTNLAEALRLDPGIAGQIGSVAVMGGSVYAAGNIRSDWAEIDNTVAEWNIWVDPLAASEVFSAGLSLHLVPLDATNQVTWTAADARAWARTGSAEGKLAADLLEMTLEAWSVKSAYIWDLAAAATATDARLCPEVELALEVVVEPGPEQGQTRVGAGPANTWVCLSPDPAQVRARAAAVIGR